MNIVLAVRIKNTLLETLEINDSVFVFDVVKRITERWGRPETGRYQLRVARSGVVMPENDELRLHVVNADTLELEIAVSPDIKPALNNVFP